MKPPFAGIINLTKYTYANGGSNIIHDLNVCNKIVISNACADRFYAKVPAHLAVCRDKQCHVMSKFKD